MKKNLVALVLSLLVTVPAAAVEELAATATFPGDISLAVSATGELVELRYADIARRWNDSFGDWEIVWQGEVEGLPGSLAVFTTIDGHTAGLVVLPDRILRVLPDG